MARRQQTDREKVEQLFCNPALNESEAKRLADIVGLILRSRFPQSAAPKRTRKTKAAPLLEVAK